MDLPTYTSIWRIEKRLYKLYDFRLPMPLPIGQITVFTAIAVPYVVLLQVLGLPFNHTLIWLYILPPGALTWLATRPVLESKRLPELVRSQTRYLAEPKVWCRMAPSSERDIVLVTGKVWRPSRAARSQRRRGGDQEPARDHYQLSPEAALTEEGWQAEAWPASALPWPDRQAVSAAAGPEHAEPEHAAPEYAEPEYAEPQYAEPQYPEREYAGAAPAHKPLVTVVGASAAAPPAVERALAGPSARRGDGRPGRVVVVPGGHRPGKPDQLHRDRARAQQPVGEPNRVVVLGCTVGAGQTITTLLTGEVLASLREDDVAVLDLNPGPASLARRALARPALSQAASLSASRLAVLGPDQRPGSGPGQPDPVADALAFEHAALRHAFVLADPATPIVPRLLAAADQLVLVAPASAAAASAITMTLEWLEAHGQGELATRSIMVLNGVSRRSIPQVEQAERVCVGRCRAIVRVPWDDQLNSQSARRAHPPAPGSQPQRWAGLLTSPAVAAYTALAGVLVAALAEKAEASGELAAAQRGQVV